MKKHIGKYIYNGIMRSIKKFYYDDFTIEYEVYQNKGIWYSVVCTYEDGFNDLSFHSSTKADCENKVIKFFKDAADSKAIYKYISEGYKIDFNYENILYTARDKNVGYHVSPMENRKSILENGLIPNGNIDMDVAAASYYMDKIKPENIPEWVIRYNAVYVSPEMTNYMIMDSICKNKDLYAVNIHYDRCWIGSEGLGGFSLFDSEIPEKDIQKFIKSAKRWWRLYWNNSCSMEDYIKNTENFTRKDKRYGLDEILIMHKLLKHDAILIGSWDSESHFHPNENFKYYVKEKFADKNKWIDILEDYKKRS